MTDQPIPPQCPNVVRYFGTVLSKPNYALVMEYCGVQLPGSGIGTSLHDLLSERSVEVRE
jgi:hypothetical protein